LGSCFLTAGSRLFTFPPFTLHSKHTLPRFLGARRTVGDVGEPDPVRRGGDEVALEQVRGDREVVTAVGGARPSWPRHDGPDTVTAHQSLDATAAYPAALGPQLGMDARAAIAATGVAVNPLDVVDKLTVGGGSRALSGRARQA
jgi:hypothetical protein